jgi:hypothetical protein
MRFRDWLERLSFSMLIVATVLAWEGYQSVQGRRGPVPTSHIVLLFAGAAICFIVALIGARLRHRR